MSGLDEGHTWDDVEQAHKDVLDKISELCIDKETAKDLSTLFYRLHRVIEEIQKDL